MRALALIGALVCAVFAASPVLAGAGVSYQPDAWVRYHSFHTDGDRYLDVQPWKGDNIYNTTGRYQTSKQRASGSFGNNPYYVFQVAIESDGAADSYRVHATGTGGPHWGAKFQRGKTNITSAVVNGTYETETLDGTQVVLKVKVFIGDPGSSIERLITITSVSDPTRTDTVRIKVSYTACGC